MRKTNKLLSILLSLVMMMTVFMPITASARTILEEEETGDMHLWITTDGFLHWDAVAGATNYRIDIYQQPSTGITPAKTVNLDSSNLYYNLYGAMDVEGFESREYRIEVYTTGGGNPHENLVFYYDSPLEKLNAPINLTWVGNEAHWDAVPNAEYYDVYLRKTTTTGGVVMKSHVTGTSVDLSEYSPENGWYFKVIAYADGYRASAIVESPRKGDSSVATSYHVGADVYNITTNEQYTGGKVKIVTPDDTGDYAYVG
ncbi:MAG: hypothetical protein IKJ68_00645, partial [Clostridia bacterium]|nr:hypothetical protein [Clostridia bacterium]